MEKNIGSSNTSRTKKQQHKHGFLCIASYLRYVDDMVILSDSKTALWSALELLVKIG